MGNERPAYQNRVIDEKKDLDMKIAKLDNYISYDSATKVGHLLICQLEIMEKYSEILRKRIEEF